MRRFRSGVPWQTVLNSWTLLDSHDTPRFRTTVGGDPDLVHAGIGLQMTTPGVPVIYAGDELGLDGAWGEDGRRPMPWSRPDNWDNVTLERYRSCAARRPRSHVAACATSTCLPTRSRTSARRARTACFVRSHACPGRSRTHSRHSTRSTRAPTFPSGGSRDSLSGEP